MRAVDQKPEYHLEWPNSILKAVIVAAVLSVVNG